MPSRHAHLIEIGIELQCKRCSKKVGTPKLFRPAAKAAKGAQLRARWQGLSHVTVRAPRASKAGHVPVARVLASALTSRLRFQSARRDCVGKKNARPRLCETLLAWRHLSVGESARVRGSRPVWRSNPPIRHESARSAYTSRAFGSVPLLRRAHARLGPHRNE